ncbi:MAG: hypothetical protein RLZZ400_198 [Actinomycetota bacterium]
MRSKLKAGTAAFALVLSLIAPTAAQSQPLNPAWVNCVPTPSFSQASKTETPLSSNLTLRTYTYSPGIANGSMFNSKISVVQGNFQTSSLQLSRPAIGEAVSQRTLAATGGALGYINTDFFDEGRDLNYSAIIENGVLTYAPPTKTLVVGITQLSYRIETGFPASDSFTIGGGKFRLTGVNQSSIVASNALVAYTPKYGKTTIPTNQVALLISGGKVQKFFKTGSTVRPKSGVLLVTTGTNASRFLKLKTALPTTFKLPKVPAPSRQLKSALVWASGSATVNNVAIDIRGVNTDATSSGARLYDSNFTTSRGTMAGDYTVVVDSAGKVKSKARGATYRVPTGGSVLQLGSDGAAFYSAATIGSTVTIDNRYSVNGSGTFFTAFGSGGQRLRQGVNSQDCDAHHEQIRPRTGLAWNSSTGDFWMITTSSGQNLNDFGFRMGGSTTHQMFDWMKQLGASDGVALDGGGTTSMFARIAGSIERIDIPNEAWIRPAPLGLIAKPND